MSMFCGIYLRAGRPVGGLEAALAALPGAETASSAMWTDGAVGLGWRGDPDLRPDRPERLPRAESGPGLAVTGSARLDDRAGLCDALGIPRGEQAGLPDSALLLRAWERWGRECPGHLLGDFAFAVWDRRRRTLFLVRDAVGTRPLFYSLSADRIVFASDVGAVLAAPGVPGALDEAAVAADLGLGYVPFGEHTHFQAVRRLRPGHALAIAGDTVHCERWWRPEDAPRVRTAGDNALAEELRELHSRAVEDRMRGVRRLGVHLSGGLDSSSVATVAARAQRRCGRPPPPAFAWQPPPREGLDRAGEATEHTLIEAVRRMHELEVFYCPPDSSGVLGYLRRDGARDLNIHPNEDFVQACAARQEIRVLLSGWGGDEGISFNGRGYGEGLLRQGRILSLWRHLREQSGRPLKAFLVRVALPLVWPDALPALQRARRGQWPVRRRGFAHPAFARRTRPVPGLRLPRGGVRRYQLCLLQSGHLAHRMDGWATSGALHGIEYAYPLLDRRLLEFALGLPPESYIRGAETRWLFRRAMAPLLPPAVYTHRDKSDPVRYSAAEDAFEGALGAVRQTLAKRPTPPARGAYVDVPRLTANLAAGSVRDLPTAATMLRTLKFLDF